MLYSFIVKYKYNMNLASKTTEESVFLAKLAEQAGQFNDMLSFLKPVLEKHEELTVDERCLVSVAFKTLCDQKRTAWNTLSGLESDPHYASVKEKISEYKKHIESELKKVCVFAISAIDEHLLKSAETAESRVFYLKIKADYYRYTGEVSTGTELEEISAKALETYLTGKKVASEGLDAINPVRLGLALNYSVFCYEIRGNPKEACQVAKSALDEAASGLQALEEDQYKDTTYIMQMIKDNLASWTSDTAEPDESPSKEEAELEFV